MSVQIPGGDLAPARRRRYGGSYGRRRRRRSLRLVAVAVIAVVVAVGWWFWHDRDTASSSPRSTLSSCPSASPRATSPALPSPSQVRVVLLNGTSRNGLAKSVGEALTARGFVVTEAANAPAALPGPSQVVWGPGGQPAALLLAQHFAGARVMADPRAAAGSVRVTLGSDFQQLSDPVSPSPVASPSASPCVSMHS